MIGGMGTHNARSAGPVSAVRLGSVGAAAPPSPSVATSIAPTSTALRRGSLAGTVLLSVALVIALHLVLGAILAASCPGGHCDDVGANWFGAPPPAAGWQGLLLGPWLRNDAVYYMQIALHGYTAPEASTGPLGIFFPLFPMLTRAAMVLTGGNALLAGLAVNAVLSVAAMTLLAVLAGDELGAAASRRSMLLLAASPAAFFLLAPLSEACFVTFTLGTVIAARRDRIALASLLAVGATLSRDQGILVLLPLGAAVVEGWRQRAGERRFPVAWADATVVLPALSLALFEWYLWGHGYPGGTFRAEAVFMHTRAAPPWQSLVQGVQLVLSPRVRAGDVLDLLAVLLLAASLPLMWRRLRRADTAYAAASLLVILLHVGGYSPLSSALRFTVATYPIWLLAATFRPSQRSLRITLTVLAAVTVFVAGAIAGFKLVE